MTKNAGRSEMKLLIEESVLRQALETFTHCYAETDRRINERAKILVELRSALDAAENVEMLDAERAECEEQARLNGMGAEREAALLAKVEMLERELAATQHVVAQFSEGERKLRAELAALRNQIDELEPVAYFDGDTSTLTFNKTIHGHAWKPVYLLEGIKK